MVAAVVAEGDEGLRKGIPLGNKVAIVCWMEDKGGNVKLGIVGNIVGPVVGSVIGVTGGIVGIAGMAGSGVGACKRWRAAKLKLMFIDENATIKDNKKKIL